MNTSRKLLDPAFVAMQRQRLMNDRKTLSESLALRENEQRSIENAAQNNGNELEDRAQDLSMVERNRILEEKWRQQLATVDRALAKIDNGTYGLSDSSGHAIPRGRLEAFPAAISTVSDEARLAKRS